MAEKQTKDKQEKKKSGKGKAAEPQGDPAPPPRLRAAYRDAVLQAVMSEFDIKNPMAAPRLAKITVNVNMGRHLDGPKLPANVEQTVVDTLRTITGQQPVIVRAKKSVSNFKVREGYPTAAMVTLRRDRMWHFLDRLIHLSTPRIKDFRGLSRGAFDRQGNYSMGLNEQGVFPEVNMAEASFTHGMNINVSFENSDPSRSLFVLEQLGMPFEKVGQN